MSQPGGRQEMSPTITSTNRRNPPAIRELDLCNLEENSVIFMRGIRTPRQDLSENLEQSAAPSSTAHCAVHTISS
jgi:hypothetical protein